MAKPLFAVFRDHDGVQTAFIQKAHAKIFAWMHSAIAGHAGKPIEIHELDPKAARKVPKTMIGRTLTAAEAKRLLAILAA